MAYDAGMMRCALYEIEKESLGARVEKLYQRRLARKDIVYRDPSGESANAAFLLPESSQALNERHPHLNPNGWL